MAQPINEEKRKRTLEIFDHLKAAREELAAALDVGELNASELSLLADIMMFVEDLHSSFTDRLLLEMRTQAPEAFAEAVERVPDGEDTMEEVSARVKGRVLSQLVSGVGEADPMVLLATLDPKKDSIN